MTVQRRRREECWEPGLGLNSDRNDVLQLLLRPGWGGRGGAPAGTSVCHSCHFTVAGPAKAADEAAASTYRDASGQRVPLKGL